MCLARKSLHVFISPPVLFLLLQRCHASLHVRKTILSTTVTASAAWRALRSTVEKNSYCSYRYLPALPHSPV